MLALHILPKLNMGGSEMLTLDLCKNAFRHNLTVYLLTSGEGELLEEFNKTPVTIHIKKRKHPIDYFYIRYIRNMVIRNKIEVIHTHQLVDTMNAYLAILGLNVKLFLTYHGHFLFNKNKILPVFQRYFAKKLDANIFVSKHLLNFYLEKHKISRKNCTVLHNGIETAKFNTEYKQSLKKELNLSSDIFLAGMVGSFTYGRDHLAVCRAIARIIKIKPEFHIVFIGGRVERYKEVYDQCFDFCVAKGISDNVHFLGIRKDVPAILKQLDLFVYSSRRDTVGIAVVEAMICGLPVILNDLPALLEVTDQGRVAEVFKTSDADDLFLKMDSLIKNADERNKLSRIANSWANENFTIDRHIDNLLKIYQS